MKIKSTNSFNLIEYIKLKTRSHTFLVALAFSFSLLMLLLFLKFIINERNINMDNIKYQELISLKPTIKCNSSDDFIPSTNYQLLRIGNIPKIRVFWTPTKVVDYGMLECVPIEYGSSIDLTKLNTFKSELLIEIQNKDKVNQTLRIENNQLLERIDILTKGYKLPTTKELDDYIETYKTYKLPVFNKWLESIKQEELKKLEKVKTNLERTTDECSFSMIQDNMEFFDLWISGDCEQLKKKIRGKNAQR